VQYAKTVLMSRNFILSAQNSQCAHPWGKGTKGTTTKQHDKGLNIKDLRNMYKTTMSPQFMPLSVAWTKIGDEHSWEE
jgi:hypothetical protein